jgi:hypothetical protein
VLFEQEMEGSGKIIFDSVLSPYDEISLDLQMLDSVLSVSFVLLIFLSTHTYICSNIKKNLLFMQAFL